MVEGLEKTRSKIVTDKVILATGITSDPLIPDYAGKADFGKPLFHGSYFRGHEELFETKGKVVVVGGSKSVSLPTVLPIVFLKAILILRTGVGCCIFAGRERG